MIWWVPALALTWVQTFVVLLNQYYKRPGAHIVLWRGMGHTVLFALPFYFIGAPQDPRFYVGLVGATIPAIYCDIRRYNASAKFGGGMVSRIMPLTLIVSFFLWFFLDVALLKAYMANPLVSAGIVACILAIMFLLFRLRSNCAINKEAIAYLVPVVFAAAVMNIAHKYAMDHTNLLEGIIAYLWLQAFIMLLASFYIIRHQEFSVKGAFSGQSRAAGLTLIVLSIAVIAFKATAMKYTPHPTYVLAIVTTTSVWVSILYRLIKHKEEARVREGLIVVFLVALMIYLTSLI